MSRIGKKPVNIPQGTTVTWNDGVITAKGKVGEISQKIDERITVDIKENEILISRGSDDKEDRAMHGLYRSLISNMVEGVSNGFTKTMELVGVGYRVAHQDQKLDLTLGYSHNIIFELPKEIKLNTTSEKGKLPTIILTSHDKQLLGAVAAKIRSFRKPEPYKGKGIRFVGEQVRRKAGKTAGK